MDLDGDTLLLELINTTTVENGVPTDALQDDDAAAAWTRARGGSGTAEELALVREVRAVLQDVVRGEAQPDRLAGYLRSEEHTSELQSRGQLVCRLLLEKKKARQHHDE